MLKITNNGLTRSGTRCCTHMATVGVKGPIGTIHLLGHGLRYFNSFTNVSYRATLGGLNVRGYSDRSCMIYMPPPPNAVLLSYHS